MFETLTEVMALLLITVAMIVGLALTIQFVFGLSGNLSQNLQNLRNSNSQTEQNLANKNAMSNNNNANQQSINNANAIEEASKTTKQHKLLDSASG